MFGWECALVGKKFFVGLQEEDEVVRFILRVDKKLHDALLEEFPELLEFDFGHWLEGEMTSVQDLERLFPAIQKAYEFTRIVAQRRR